MSIIESHLFSQFRSYGIAGDTASLTLTVYGIATMLGAAGTGFLGVRYRMKNVLGCVYTIRVLISLGFLFLPKSVPFALIGHQVGAFASSFLGGVLVRAGLGYIPLWIINMCLSAIAATASFSIRNRY